jgi:hypothetical protein
MAESGRRTRARVSPMRASCNERRSAESRRGPRRARSCAIALACMASIVVTIGCGTTGPLHPEDAGESGDVSVSDANGAVDVAGTVDAPATGDACHGCSLAPACTASCGDPCGCCNCPQGDEYCEGGVIFRCLDPSCYSVADTCPSASACVVVPGVDESSAFCARSAADCSRLASTYMAVVASGGLTPVAPGSSGLPPGAYNPSCDAIGCGIVGGHCDLGLGACWYLGRPEAELDQLATLYQSLGCAASVPCQCPPQQVAAVCETNPDGGLWIFDGGLTATSACVVQ